MLDGTVGDHRVTLALPRIPLAGGQYFWNARMWNAETGETLIDTPMKFPMVIDDEGHATGALALDHEWGPVIVSPVSAGSVEPKAQAGAPVGAGDAL